MPPARAVLIWAALALAIGVPLALALASPLLAWRGPIEILAGLAGVLALGLVLVQPLLVDGRLPGLAGHRGPRAHRVVGGALVAAVVLHVAGLWIVSPPDMLDALTFASPTPFSPWGVVALAALLTAVLLAAMRRRLGWSPRLWRRVHTLLVLVVAVGGVVHSLLVEGAMEAVSKAVLCALALAAVVAVVARRRVWRKRVSPKAAE